MCPCVCKGTVARLTQIEDTAHNITYFQNPSYFPGGQLNQATFGSVIETSIYNSRLQPCWYYATTGTALSPTTPCSGTSSAANVLDLKYNFGSGTNDNGNVLSVTNNKDSNRSVTYTYDTLNRIASAITPNSDCTVLPSGSTKNWGESFTIDAWGNLSQRNVTKCSAEPLSVTPLPNNRLAELGYDASGNVTSNGGANYTYDAESRLKTAGGVTYTYDGDGNRVKKSSGTEYWGAGTLIESDGSGNFQREFIFAGGRRIARRDIATGNFYYYFNDLLGSADVVINASGAIQNESDYYPYGGERVYSQALTNQNYKFIGKERDAESGLDYLGARHYGSSLGRFMQVDPVWVKGDRMVDPQRLNLYAYGRNNSVRFTDPTGMDVAMGNCPGSMTISMCEAAVKDGLNKQDRDHVHFVQGDGKNGFAKGVWGVQVDQDYKSNSGNFQTLQKAAGDHSALAVFNFEPVGFKPDAAVAAPKRGGGLMMVDYPAEYKAVYGDFPGLTPVGGMGIQGLTASQLWGAPIKWGVYNAYGDNTQVYLVADTSLEMTVNFYHELQHVVLGDFGRHLKAGLHNEPGVNNRIGAAQEEAKDNASQK